MADSHDPTGPIDDVLLNKAAVIERCLQRIADEYQGHETELATDLRRQDAVVLNLQRTCRCRSRHHRTGGNNAKMRSAKASKSAG